MTEAQVFLSLGTNLGDRVENLKSALARLRNEQISIQRNSSVYETAPQDLEEQPWFLNMVVECRTRLFPLQLLAAIGRIERALGRDRAAAAVPKGPRVIDIDVLLYGSALIRTPELIVPHPRMLQRRFVLAPLLEIAPELNDPLTGMALRDALAATSDQAINRLNSSESA